MEDINSGIGLVIFLILCFGLGGIGSIFTSRGVTEWYGTLAKPSWTPPNKVFGPVWSLLYLLMAIAAWKVWANYGFSKASLPLAFFGFQLLLNLAWPFLFFGKRNPKAAFIDICILWVIVLVTLITFWQHDQISGCLFIPYILWVTYAVTLNYGIIRLNSELK